MFMDQGRECAIDLSPMSMDRVMSKCFSKDDTDVVSIFIVRVSYKCAKGTVVVKGICDSHPI